jgi:hypothetical protein
MWTADEHQKILSQRKEVIQKDSRLKQAIRSAVAAEHVTADEDWDHFLTYISGMLEKFQEGKKGIEASILKSLSSEETAVLKYSYHRILGTLEALEWAVGLPKAIKDNSNVAKEILAEERASDLR